MNSSEKRTVLKENMITMVVLFVVIALFVLLIMWLLGMGMGMELVIPGPWALMLSVATGVLLLFCYGAACYEDIDKKEAEEQRSEAREELADERDNHDKTRGFIRQFLTQEAVTTYLTGWEAGRSQLAEKLTTLLMQGSGDVERTVDAGREHLQKIADARQAVVDVETDIEAASELAREHGFEVDAERNREIAEHAHKAPSETCAMEPDRIST